MEVSAAGNPSGRPGATIEDLYAYEAGQLPLFPESGAQQRNDVREVANYVQALTYGLERLKELPVSLRLLRELHERLMEGVRGEKAYPGEFRRTQDWIGPPGCTLAEARFVPPPVPEMYCSNIQSSPFVLPRDYLVWLTTLPRQQLRGWFLRGYCPPPMADAAT
ncbi:MAG TPA: hypothetical protein GX716_03720 [Firmicutes bacterium]|jgi:hypothetical protein|nr:hypothetical protein [Candidatus Fermentithermobacillaceae bacterium]